MHYYHKQTRCPHCETSYRITLDQLTIGHGQVLCAECQQQFNAIEHLHEPIDLNPLPISSWEKHRDPTENPFDTDDKRILDHQEIFNFFKQNTPHSPLSLLHYLDRFGAKK